MAEISTGVGDNGMTQMGCGISLRKDDPRIEAYGSVDELSSILGLVVASTENPGLQEKLKTIQKELYLLCSDLATDSQKCKITEEHINGLEKMENEIEPVLPKLTKFILPGGTKTGSLIHVARAICRRCERKVVFATTKYDINKNLIVYLNRLSDLLYLMARNENAEAGISDERLEC